MQEASDSGWPLIRPLLLHYPDDRNTWDLKTQFLFGEKMLVAPVLSKTLTYERKTPVIGQVVDAHASISVYLPRGNWTRLWHEEEVYASAGQSYDLKVKIGEPAVFYVQGWDYGATLSSFVKEQLDVAFPAPKVTNTAWNNCA